MKSSPLSHACRRILGHSGSATWASWDPHPPARSFHPDDPRLLFCVSGHLGLRLGDGDGGRRERLAPGSCAVIPPGCWFSHHDSPRCRMLNLALRDGWLDCRARRRTPDGWRDERIGLCAPADRPVGIDRAILLAAELARSASADAQSIHHAARCTLALLAAALEAGMPLQGYRGGRGDLRWRQLRDCIHEHLHLDLGRERVADLLGIHPNHVSRICAQHGERFVDLVNRARIQAACRMMAEGSQPIADIAERCGFASPQYFSRVFRRMHGCSPGTWRSGA